MKLRILIVLLLLIISCGITMYGQTNVRISLSDSAAGFTGRVYEVLQEHPEGNLTLEFEPGVYHFYPEKAIGRYVSVSNNDNGYKRIAFCMDGMKNVEIKGNRTEFIFHGKIMPFYMLNCTNVSIAGIDIDCADSYVFEGTVIANSPESKSFDLQVRDDVRYKVKGHRLFWYGYDWEQSLGENIVFDPETRSPYYNTVRFLHRQWENELMAEDLGNGRVRLSKINSAEMPPVGSVYTDKGMHGTNRMYPNIVIHTSAGIRLNDMNIYGSGAMAMIAECSSDITLRGFNVRLRQGSNRTISASADATHFVNCRGTVIFEDCTFENMLDDATNVHGTHTIVNEYLSDRCIGVRFGHYQQEGFLFAAPGDTLKLIDRSSLTSHGQFIVDSIIRINENYYRIYSQAPIPRPSSPETLLVVENLSGSASVVMRRCTVRQNRARSILISTPRPVLIEDCRFSSMMAGILISGDGNYWFESGNVEDVIIRRNIFECMGNGGENPQSVLHIAPVIPPDHRNEGFYHGRIVFEDNTIRTFDSQVIYALSVRELIIRNNRFIQTKDYAPIFPGLPYIDLQYCRNVWLEGNTYQGSDGEAEVSVLNCGKITYSKQKGFLSKTLIRPNTYYYH
jgi:hypothetical protein